MTEDFFDKLLNFGPDWKVDKIVCNENNEVDIYLKWQLDVYKRTNIDTYEFIHDYREIRRWRHLDIMQYKTFICAKIPRIKSKDGSIESVKVPWAGENERHTFLFERLAIDLLLATRNQTQTAHLLRTTFNIVNRIIHLSTKRGLARRDKNVVYKRLSLDEKSQSKGHNYVTVLSDPDRGIIIDVAEGRTKKSCTELLNKNLSLAQIAEVDTVSLDMWMAFNTSVDEILPKAKKVHDRFHLIKYLNEAVDNVRRREVKTNEALRNSRYSLLKNIPNFTEKQYFKFEEILRLNTTVSHAWRLKECFRNLSGCADYREAFKRFSDWSDFCIWEGIPEIVKVVNMFKNHIKGVCNALVETASNAMAERLNGKIQEIKTIGRGYRKFENFRSAILFFNGGLDLYPH